MPEHPLAQDLIASMQKRPLLRVLRDLRNETTSRDQAILLGDLINMIVAGDFDG